MSKKKYAFYIFVTLILVSLLIVTINSLLLHLEDRAWLDVCIQKYPEFLKSIGDPEGKTITEWEFCHPSTPKVLSEYASIVGELDVIP